MAASVPIPEIVQAMILLNTMPKEYNRIVQTLSRHRSNQNAHSITF